MPERLSPQRPSEPRGTMHTAIGTIKWWKPAKGYGAIACADTAPWDIWFHYSTLESPRTSWEGGTIEPGFIVEVEFHRADQESFSYIADAVRRPKP
jgi:cold shock CspA family protein